MPQDDGWLHLGFAVEDVKVGSANTAGPDPQEYVEGSHARRRSLFKPKAMGFVKDSGFHAWCRFNL